MGILLEFLCKFVHLLTRLEKFLAFCKIVDLFLCSSLSDLSNLVYLVLGFIDRAHLNACIIVLVYADEVFIQLLIIDI